MSKKAEYRFSDLFTNVEYKLNLDLEDDKLEEIMLDTDDSNKR